MAIGVSRHGSAYITASGAVGIAAQPKYVYAMHIISGSTPGVVTLKDNGTGGTLYVKQAGAANQGVTINFGEGFMFPTDCYATLDANVVSVIISYDEYYSG